MNTKTRKKILFTKITMIISVILLAITIPIDICMGNYLHAFTTCLWIYISISTCKTANLLSDAMHVIETVRKELQACGSVDSDAARQTYRFCPELKESEGEKIRKKLIDLIYKVYANSSYITCVEHANKIKPKFKVGDWFINISKDVFLIKSFNNGYCTLEDIKGNIISPCLPPCESESRLWTILDAKDGDVLINWNNTAFIFKTIEDETVKFHIAYNKKWDSIKTPSTKLSHLGLPEPQFEYHPATKSQRDTLFAKMKEDGYEWDTEKRELKKFEQKSDSFCREHSGKCIVDGGCKAKKEAEQKSAWREEDSAMVEDIVKNLKKLQLQMPNYRVELQMRWLKSLRPQNHWKPSDEQIKVCKEVYADILSAKGFDLGTVNSELNRMEEQLKKLKEENI